MYDSHYHTLDIAPDASDTAIRKAYKQKAKRLHPDVNKSANAEAEFLNLKEAFETLIDPNKRFIYDSGDQRNTGFKNVGQYVKGARQFRYMPNYEQWMELKKQKNKKDADAAQEKFFQKRNHLKASKYYRWHKTGFYAKIYGIYFLSFIVFFLSAYFLVKTHFVFSFVVIPVPCAAAFAMLWAYRTYRSEIRLYQ